MATQAVALDISNAFDRVWYAGLLHKLKFYGISRQIFGLISSLSQDIISYLQYMLEKKNTKSNYPYFIFIKYVIFHFLLKTLSSYCQILQTELS